MIVVPAFNVTGFTVRAKHPATVKSSKRQQNTMMGVSEGKPELSSGFGLRQVDFIADAVPLQAFDLRTAEASEQSKHVDGSVEPIVSTADGFRHSAQSCTCGRIVHMKFLWILFAGMA